MRVFRTRLFSRFTAAERIADSELCAAVFRANAGLLDADLGGHVIKQRLARKGQGKSGGYRTIILFHRGNRAFFVYGFARNERDNIRRDELLAFRRMARDMLTMDAKALGLALASGSITEIACDG